jgi:hypothetical protein
MIDQDYWETTPPSQGFDEKRISRKRGGARLQADCLRRKRASAARVSISYKLSAILRTHLQKIYLAYWEAVTPIASPTKRVANARKPRVSRRHSCLTAMRWVGPPDISAFAAFRQTNVTV